MQVEVRNVIEYLIPTGSAWSSPFWFYVSSVNWIHVYGFMYWFFSFKNDTYREVILSVGCI